MIIDFETYSEAGYTVVPGVAALPDIPKKPGIAAVGADVYARHPSTKILCLVYDGNIWMPQFPWHPIDLFQYVNNGGLLTAHNSMFEYLVWNFVGVLKYGFPPVPLDQFRCTAARCRNWGLPGELAKAGAARSLPIQKDPAGDGLIKHLSIPQKNGARKTIRTHPDLFTDMVRYCIQDVKAEACVDKFVPELTSDELRAWQADRRINARGVYIDRGMVKRLKRVATWEYERQTKRLADITNKTITSTDQSVAIAAYVGLPSVDKAHVSSALADPQFPEHFKEVLRIRQTVSGSAAKKLWALDAQACDDDRVRGLFIYAGAERTGRWAAVGPQPQNLKSGGPDYMVCPACKGLSVPTERCPRCLTSLTDETHEWNVDAMEAFYKDVKTFEPAKLEAVWGDLISVIGSSIRGLFIAAPGHEFISSDYSAIEAVVIACLAGEQWRIDVFNSHGKIYEASTSKASGIPLEDILAHKQRTGKHHPLRKLGKVRELANGYGGWIKANKNFGADKFMTDDEIKADVLKWREESPRIVEFWGGQWRKDPDKWGFTRELYGLEGAAITAIATPDTPVSVGIITYQYSSADQVLYCTLPSGRRLAYHYPELNVVPNKFHGGDEYRISFMGYNSNAAAGPVGWVKHHTYSGKLAENVVQAVANDILRHAIVALEDACFPVVLTVHDEVVCECPVGSHTVEELESVMSTMPAWAKDWPIKARGGWKGKRFRK